MLIVGILIVVIGLLLYFLKGKEVEADGLVPSTPYTTPDAMEAARVLLEGAGVVVPPTAPPKVSITDPDAPIAPIEIPMETKVIEQIGVEVEVPTITYVEQQIAKAALTGDISGGMSEEVFEEYFQKPAAEAIGLTMAEIPTYSAVADKVNLELGGRYINGILTPPSGWVGSTTEWSRYVQQVALQKYNELKAGVA